MADLETKFTADPSLPALALLQSKFAVCRLAPEQSVPEWAWTGPLCAVTRTPEELSIVCADKAVPPAVAAERSWRALRVVGTLDFGLVGILARLTEPLANGNIGVFAISTYDTDYLLIKEHRLEHALVALRAAGWTVRR